MLTILNQTLPIYFMLLPLGIAALLAANLYRVQNTFSKIKANYQAQLREAQNRLDESIASEKELRTAALNGVHELKDVTAKLHKAESDGVEREALVRTLRADLSNESEILQGRIADKNAVISEKDAQIEYLNRQIERKRLEIQDNELAVEQIKSKLSEREKLINELYASVSELHDEGVDLKDLNDILYGIVQANSRTRKAYSKYLDSKKPTETPQSETVVHDILGVARVFQADQSENVNNRHTVVNICNEVNRGIAEQAERIRQELEVVDMSQLESGDMVKLRNKENRTVIDVFNNGALGRPFGITINKGTSTVSLFYDKNGHYDCVKHGFDIIQIIKPAKCYKSNKPCEFGCNGLCKDA